MRKVCVEKQTECDMGIIKYIHFWQIKLSSKLNWDVLSSFLTNSHTLLCHVRIFKSFIVRASLTSITILELFENLFANGIKYVFIVWLLLRDKIEEEVFLIHKNKHTLFKHTSIKYSLLLGIFGELCSSIIPIHAIWFHIKSTHVRHTQ